MQRQVAVQIFLPEDVSNELGAYSKAHKLSKASAVAVIVADRMERFRADIAEGIS